LRLQDKLSTAGQDVSRIWLDRPCGGRNLPAATLGIAVMPVPALRFVGKGDNMQCEGTPMFGRLIGLAVLLALPGGEAAAQEAIGTVSRMQGEASGILGGTTQPLSPNASVFLNEILSTGEAARLEVTFTDSTRLTLGEKAKLTLGTYVFNPAARRRTIRLALVGAVRFVSGKLSKLVASSVSLTTPVANVGIRGTEFFAGPIDDQALGVFLIEGAVTVSNAAGQRILNRPGQGTNIAAPGAAPGPVTLWPPAKVDRALAAVSFQ
jgi:ferric-dicitrate binding protein FerR (iron transport regulator)